jgi:hypothetical protein
MSHSLDDLPQMFTLLQQTNNQTLADTLVKMVIEHPNTVLWTDFCKRIVIHKCVPPTETVGDSRVIPTRLVLVTAMRISVQLVSSIRSNFPVGLNSLDDIVSIAFNAIQMNDRRIDADCFAILASVLRSFADVRNKDGSLLNIYTAQFDPIFAHSLDGSRALASVIEFCIAYLDFLVDTQNELLDGAALFAIESLVKHFQNENLTVFCRMAARLNRICSKRIDFFESAILKLFNLVAQQKVELKELGNQLPDAVLLYLNSPKPATKLLLLLLLKELSERFSPVILKALTETIAAVELSPSQADFALSIVANYPLPQTPVIVVPTIDNDDLDATTFWIVPRREVFLFHRFLDAVAARINRENWAKCFTLALAKPVAFSALARLVNAAEPRLIERLAGCAIANVLDGEEKCLAFCVMVFGKVGVNVADSLISFVTRSEIENTLKFGIIRAGFRRFGKFELKAYQTVAEYVCGGLYPDGVNFVVSLLLDEQLELSGLTLLRLGVVDNVVNSITQSMRSLPRILHFLNVSLTVVRKYVKNNSEFECGLVKVVFRVLKLIGSQPERVAVLAPACRILRAIDQRILSEQWEVETAQVSVLVALEPPVGKRHAEIELKMFADAKPRRAAAGGWQSLDIDND